MSKISHLIGQPMLGQLLKLINRSKILEISREKGGVRYIKRFNCWVHLAVKLFAVIKRFDSLSEITAGLLGESRKLCHLGIGIKTSRSTLSDGSKSIYIDHVLNGKHTKYFLSLYLLPEETGKARKLNASTKRKAENLLKERQADLLKSQLDEENAEKTNHTLLSSWMDTYYNYLIGKGAKEDNTKHIFIVKSHLEKYRPGCTLSVIDRPFILGFIDFLRNDYQTRLGPALTPYGMIAYFGFLRTALNAAVREQVISENPVNRIPLSERIKKPESTRVYLTIDEVKMMIDTDCKKEIVKKAFLFSCYCGLG